MKASCSSAEVVLVLEQLEPPRLELADLVFQLLGGLPA